MPQGLLPFSSEHPHQKFLSQQRSGCLSRTTQHMARFRPRAVKLFFIGVLVFCASMYLVFSRFIMDKADFFIEENAQHIPEAVINRRLDFQSSTVDRICSPTTSVCYTVMDKRTPDDVVERHLIVDGFVEESDTVVRLIPPEGEKFDTSDSRMWKIDHKHINSQYVAGLLIAPFLVSALALEGPGDNERVLEIGLGGGSLDMALANLKPKIEITAVELDGTVIALAEKWFGISSSANRKHVERDGVQVIREMKVAGEKLDVLVIDACDDSKSSPCPASPFQQKSLVEDMKSLLKQQGVLLVNILAHDEEDEPGVYSGKIISAYTDVFPTCLQMKFTMEINIVLVCLPYTVADSEEQLRFYRNRLRTTVSSLGLQYVLGDAFISRSKP